MLGRANRAPIRAAAMPIPIAPTTTPNTGRPRGTLFGWLCDSTPATVDTGSRSVEISIVCSWGFGEAAPPSSPRRVISGGTARLVLSSSVSSRSSWGLSRSNGLVRAQKCFAHHVSAGPSSDLVERQCAIDDLGEPRWYVGCDRRHQWRWLRRRQDERLLCGPTLVDVSSDEQGERGRANRPNVGLRVDLAGPTEGLLGWHEGRGSEQGSALRLARRSLPQASDAEVEDPQSPVAREEQVLGLEIPMDDSLCVRRTENVEQLGHERHDLSDAQPPVAALPPMVERLAVE